MGILIRESKHIARKDYSCDDSEWLTTGDVMIYPSHFSISYSDMRILVKIRSEN